MRSADKITVFRPETRWMHRDRWVALGVGLLTVMFWLFVFFWG